MKRVNSSLDVAKLDQTFLCGFQSCQKEISVKIILSVEAIDRYSLVYSA